MSTGYVFITARDIADIEDAMRSVYRARDVELANRLGSMALRMRAEAGIDLEDTHSLRILPDRWAAFLDRDDAA